MALAGRCIKVTDKEFKANQTDSTQTAVLFHTV
jgi:hypothetical protein